MGRNRAILIGLAGILVIVGGLLWWSGNVSMGFALVGGGAMLGAIATLIPPPEQVDAGQPEEMELLEQNLQNELVRGTSMHLRNMKYRYSIRFDHSGRDCFTAEVNTVRLGFIPVVILDNATDRQGYGFVAFPHDGHRWRGPGLPCGGSPEVALEHAARCVAPLHQTDSEEDAAGTFDDDDA